MAKVRQDFRIDSELAAWVYRYAEERGWSRTLVVEEALRSFREGVEGGVPKARGVQQAVEKASAHDGEGSGSGRAMRPEASSASAASSAVRRGAGAQSAAPASSRAPVEERRFCPHGCGRVFKADKSYCDGCGRDYESGEDVFAEFRGR